MYGATPKDDLDIISSIIYSETRKSKNMPNDAEMLAKQIKSSIEKAGSMEGILSTKTFPSLNSDHFQQARSREFKSTSDENDFKRIIQIAHLIISGRKSSISEKPKKASRSKKDISPATALTSKENYNG